MDDWRQYIGKRVLIKGPWKSAHPKEVLIEEISRDGSMLGAKMQILLGRLKGKMEDER